MTKSGRKILNFNRIFIFLTAKLTNLTVIDVDPLISSSAIRVQGWPNRDALHATGRFSDCTPQKKGRFSEKYKYVYFFYLYEFILKL